jgi:hypothetical protein
MMASSRAAFGLLDIFSNHTLWHSNAHTKPKSLKMRELGDHEFVETAQIRELRKTAIAIIDGLGVGC